RSVELLPLPFVTNEPGDGQNQPFGATVVEIADHRRHDFASPRQPGKRKLREPHLTRRACFCCSAWALGYHRSRHHVKQPDKHGTMILSIPRLACLQTTSHLIRAARSRVSAAATGSLPGAIGASNYAKG